MALSALLRTSAMLALAVAVPTVAAPAKTVYGDFGLDLAARDPAVKPGDDFWAYANGGWDKATAIPADRASTGPFVLLRDASEANVRTILDDMAANPAKYGATGQQVGDFYASWMDTAGIEAKGTAPLKPYLATIAAARDRAALQTLFASVGYATPVEIDIIPSLADPTQYTAVATQGGLGMPRDNSTLR